MAEVGTGVLGRTLRGDEQSRVIEVVDAANTRGWLIFTHSDASRSPEVFDS